MSPPQCASLGGAVSSNVDAIGGLGRRQLPLLRAVADSCIPAPFPTNCADR
jgi:hypothetical protein